MKETKQEDYLKELLIKYVKIGGKQDVKKRKSKVHK